MKTILSILAIALITSCASSTYGKRNVQNRQNAMIDYQIIKELRTGGSITKVDSLNRLRVKNN